MGIGPLVGIYLGGIAFTLFFQNYRDATAAFLLGLLLASIKPVIADCPKPRKNDVIAVIAGTIISLLMVEEGIGTVIKVDVSWYILFIGGALATATMIIPGIPGNAVLILLGIYDSMIYFIAELNILNLLIYGVGGIVGILLLANVLNIIYNNHKVILSYFFAGLILGSARGLIPGYFDPAFIPLFLIGFGLVWRFSQKEKEVETGIETKIEPEEDNS